MKSFQESIKRSSSFTAFKLKYREHSVVSLIIDWEYFRWMKHEYSIIKLNTGRSLSIRRIKNILGWWYWLKLFCETSALKLYRILWVKLRVNNMMKSNYKWSITLNINFFWNFLWQLSCKNEFIEKYNLTSWKLNQESSLRLIRDITLANNWSI